MPYNFDNLKKAENYNFSGLQSAPPEPPPFNLDKYVDDHLAGKPDEEAQQQKQSFSKVLFNITKDIQAQLYGSAAVLNRGLAGFASHLDAVTDFISESTGMDKGSYFENIAKEYDQNAKWWKERADKVGISFLDEIVSEVLGGTIPGVTQFSLDLASGLTLPYMAGASKAYKEGKQPFVNGILEAGKTGVLGTLFYMIGPLKQYLKAPIMGIVFGTQEAEHAPEGEKAKAFAKGAAIGAAYSLSSPGGQMGVGELTEGVRRAILEKVIDNHIKNLELEKQTTPEEIQPESIATDLNINFDKPYNLPDGREVYQWTDSDPGSPAYKATFTTLTTDRAEVEKALADKRAEFAKNAPESTISGEGVGKVEKPPVQPETIAKPTQNIEKKEHIVSAVIQVGDKRYEAPTHAEAINKALKEGTLVEKPDGYYTSEGEDLYGTGWTDLFKTSKGRIINRFKADQEFNITAGEDISKQLPKPEQAQGKNNPTVEILNKLKNINVKVKVIREKTGEIFEMESTAEEALNDIKAKRDILSELRNCLS